MQSESESVEDWIFEWIEIANGPSLA